MSENLDALGGSSSPVVVAGWSAGANLAAVTCQTARDRGGPAIDGQVLVCPVTDSDFSRQSYVDNAEGYILTQAMMSGTPLRPKPCVAGKK